MKLLRFAIFLVPILAGCASAGGKEGGMSACTEINNAIGDNAKEISGTALSRGKVNDLSVPAWIPAGPKAVSVITNRQTARIEKLQAEQSNLRATREQRCK